MAISEMLELNDGGSLAYKEYEGSGIPIVLIHGFPLSQSIWQPQVDVLTKENRRVVTYDMRGFGNSSDPKGQYSHEADLKTLLDVLMIEQCHLVGMSFGGEIATSFTIEYPEYVKELTLIAAGINGYIPKEPAPFARWSKMAKSGRLEDVKNELLSYGELGELAHAKPKLHQKIADIVNEYRGYMFNGDQRIYPKLPTIGRLNEIQCKTNIVVGLEDSVDSLEQSKILSQRIPNSFLEEVFGVGHFVNLERPEIINEIVSII